MAGGYSIYLSRIYEFLEELVTNPARSLLQVVVGRENATFAKVKGKAGSGGKLADEFRVRDRCRASDPVLDVHHAQCKIPARAQLAQGMQQEYGIRAA
jgi:hypothetical protein